MTEIVINLERGPDDQPVGQLRTGSGQTVLFTGWLNLIRVLEDELRRSPRPSGPTGEAHPAAPDAS
jgi:hypothetical protein